MHVNTEEEAAATAGAVVVKRYNVNCSSTKRILNLLGVIVVMVMVMVAMMLVSRENEKERWWMMMIVIPYAPNFPCVLHRVLMIRKRFVREDYRVTAGLIEINNHCNKSTGCRTRLSNNLVLQIIIYLFNLVLLTY